MSRPAFYYMPMRIRDQITAIVGEPIIRVRFARKAVDTMTPAELEYVDAMLAAPLEKDLREAAFLAAYSKLLSTGQIPFCD